MFEDLHGCYRVARGDGHILGDGLPNDSVVDILLVVKMGMSTMMGADVGGNGGGGTGHQKQAVGMHRSLSASWGVVDDVEEQESNSKPLGAAVDLISLDRAADQGRVQWSSRDYDNVPRYLCGVKNSKEPPKRKDAMLHSGVISGGGKAGLLLHQNQEYVRRKPL